MGIHWNYLSEAIPMNIHNVYIYKYEKLFLASPLSYLDFCFIDNPLRAELTLKTKIRHQMSDQDLHCMPPSIVKEFWKKYSKFQFTKIFL